MKNRKIKPKKGQSFWKCSVFEGKVDFQEWIVRSIQNRTVKSSILAFEHKRLVAYFTCKEKGLTWVKRSKKHFDWGWDKNIPRECRLDFPIKEDGTIDCYWRTPYTTRLQAARACLKHEKGMLTSSERDLERALTPDETAEHREWIAEYTRGVTALKRAITREQRKGKK